MSKIRALKRTLLVYSEQIRHWGKGVVSDFRRLFSASADTYRAQLERIFAGTGASIDERNALHTDLEELGATAETVELRGRS